VIRLEERDGLGQKKRRPDKSGEIRRIAQDGSTPEGSRWNKEEKRENVVIMWGGGGKIQKRRGGLAVARSTSKKGRIKRVSYSAQKEQRYRALEEGKSKGKRKEPVEGEGKDLEKKGSQKREE